VWRGLYSSRWRHRRRDLGVAASLTWKHLIHIVESLVVPLLVVGSGILITVVVIRAFTWADMTASMTVVKDRVAAENEVYRTLGQVLGGALILAGLYFTSKSFAVARQSQATDRLSSALESLASADLPRRLGGINSLAAQLKNPAADYDMICETLCGFIRATTTEPSYVDEHKQAPREDVQAALVALGNRRRSGFRTHRFLLHKVILPGATFDNGDYAGFQFDHADLSGSSFFRANLAAARFLQASVSDCNFNQCDLRRCDFRGANAKQARFRRAFLDRTLFNKCNLTQSSFDGTTLTRVVFASSTLSGASFLDAHLRSCNVAGVLVHDLQLDKAVLHDLKGYGVAQESI
jgi:uncharacterized protein YjbI with pentapeptide repeats